MSDLPWMREMAEAPSVILYRPELLALSVANPLPPRTKERLWLPVRSADALRHFTPGRLVWVKERFAQRVDVDVLENPPKARRYAMIEARFSEDLLKSGDWGPSDPANWHQFQPWQPGWKMPLALTRFFLKVVEARLKAPGDITEEAARAYGFTGLDQFRRYARPRCEVGVELTFNMDCPQPEDPE